MGYAIRGETKTCDDTRLLFCTTGVLLRRLERDPTLAGVPHVLVDEVHERTVEGDFLLMALKELLGRREGGEGAPESPRTNVKLGLMSATMDGDVLARYFDGAPRVSFPGRAFPVATLHLRTPSRHDPTLGRQARGVVPRIAPEPAQSGEKGGERRVAKTSVRDGVDIAPDAEQP